MLGMVAGAVTAFFFDPQNGDVRRQRLQELWEDNRGLAEGAGQTATAAARRAKPALERAGRELTRSSRSGWQAPSSGVLTGILMGAAATGAALYLFDPADGSRRREKLVALVTDKWQEAAETGQELAASSGDAARRIRRQATGTAGQVFDRVIGK